ncbi:MAG TPA: HD domain-containing protein [Candidatus Fusicatenibacter intestinigallinarum]|uniref:HD domain-containing protein n=1 Tax=Candidatus Fusicatenibacter intestinigallinarum TaxID=2838598 RepID=A0A9D2SMP0_9FIRM|nr:HD domain-containing protein [Candidatus Fusicatenibacter intestinigallinarum]
MKYINELREGNRMSGIYLCKHRQPAVTKNGKPYENVILQDRTGTIDAKIWEPNSQGIDEFEVFDYIDIVGDVNSFNGALQVSIKRVRKAGEGEYNPADYLPTSRYDIEEMYQTLLKYIHSVKNPYLLEMLENLFVKNQELAKNFRTSSAAKNVHHGFVGGLLEHTLSVTRFCDFMAKVYPILNRDLLISAAILHDIGKTRELSAFPQNDYTDDGQLLGHIMIGAEMVHDEAGKIAGFPADLENKLKHCILAHHGELEYGSPKKPALAEAMALNLADNADAKMETLTELFASNTETGSDWLGYNRLFESNIRRTGEI